MKRACRFVELQVADLEFVDVPADSVLSSDEDKIAANPTAIVDTGTTHLVKIAARKLTPFKVPFSYVFVVHPSQIGHLKHNNRWMKRVAEPLTFTVRDAVGISDRVLIVESEFVRCAVVADGKALDTARRAVIFGADGLSSAITFTTYAAKWSA